jgi:CMP-N-acetylneuraminic acid synthetase
MGVSKNGGKMKVTALLPMKGHSERVPNKNMKIFFENPLYHCVATILEMSELVDSIIINTDSFAIAEDAIKYFPKVKIIERPEDICGDMISMNDIIKHDLKYSANEHILQTHSTNPLLSPKTLNSAIKRYFELQPEYDSLFSVTKIQTRIYWDDGKPVNHNPKELINTQDLPPLYEDNSNLYIFSKQSFTASGNNRIGLRPQMFPIEKLEAVDIDDEDDFKIAELLYRSKREA